jgi:6-phosphogluconate dehydrogenase
MTAAELHETFARWQEGELDSYLIEITRDIFLRRDPETGEPLVELILDTAGQKGTGKWTSASALDLGVPAPTIIEAVLARSLSAMKRERVEAAKVLRGPDSRFEGDRRAFVDAIHDALYCSKIGSYAQGFALLAAAAAEYRWPLDFGGTALLWRGGCIIRARFLERIKEAFDRDPGLRNLFLDPFFHGVLESRQANWRRVVSEAVRLGVPIPAFASALAYYDGYRRARLPANLLQAQRDYFGAHTFERIDKPGIFHVEWTSPSAESGKA